ncbi:MAG: T9SS type A sorting domain-containing protein [Chitinophagales bacterium]|nr:T9SS type A sorting domain-containing protein [Chitinophagales bacterium]
MKKMYYWLLISLFSVTVQAQTSELVYWTGQNTFTYSYPQTGTGLSSEISTASQNYSGLVPYNDNRNVWTNPNDSATVNAATDPYLSYTLDLNDDVQFDRFIVHGAAPTTTGIKMQLRWSEDGFATALGEFTPGTSNYNLTSVNLGTTNVVTSSSVEFRIYYYAVIGNVFHSGTGPYPTTDGTPGSYTSYGRCFSIWGQASSACAPSSGTDTRTECNVFTWIDGNTYSANNNTATYNYGGGASNGCDSIVTLDLTIVPSASSTDVQNECNAFTWVDGNTYTASNNTATYTFVGAAKNGCDSVVSLDLTILNSAVASDARTECNAYTWVDGNTYTSSNNTASYTYSGAAKNGCDSVVSLDLTIVNSPTGTDTYSECNSMTWIDGNTYTSSNNSATYTFVGAAKNGCDSVVTLNLTILGPANGTDQRDECDAITWIDGNTYTSSNSSATFLIQGGAKNGCDSMVTLNLTVNSVDTGISLSGVTVTSNATGVAYQWLDCNNSFSAISGATAQSFTAGVNGSYAVRVDNNGCVDTSACKTITTVGIVENTFEDEFTIYPNPTNGKFSVEFINAQTILSATLYTISGKEIGFRTVDNSSTIDLEINGAPGVYLIELSDNENRKAIMRIVKK